MRLGRLVGQLLTSITFLTVLPLSASAQVADEPSMLRLDARLGLAEHDEGGSASIVELALQNRGPVLVGFGVGIRHSLKPDIDLLAYEPIEFRGQRVTIEEGTSRFRYALRLGGMAGYAFRFQGLSIEPTIQGGWALSGERDEWQPWGMWALAFRDRASGIGVQGGIGQDRVGVRYHAEDTGALVAEFHNWNRFAELVLSIPLI